MSEPIDTLNFYAEQPFLGFLETTDRRYDFEPQIPTVKNRQYLIELYQGGRVVVKEELDDGWKIVYDASPDPAPEL